MWQSHVQRYCASYIGMTGWFMHIGIYLRRCVGIEAQAIENEPARDRTGSSAVLVHTYTDHHPLLNTNVSLALYTAKLL